MNRYNKYINIIKYHLCPYPTEANLGPYISILSLTFLGNFSGSWD